MDDDATLRRFIGKELGARGLDVTLAGSGEEALARAAEIQFDVVLLDVMMPGMDGLTALRRLRVMDPAPEVLILTGQGSVDSAVEAMRAGAFHYLTKPFHMGGLEIHIEKAREKAALARRARSYERILTSHTSPLVGESAALAEVRELILQVASADTSVVIEGESGTGKEIVARAVHDGSPRSGKPFVVVNCGALTESLLESELFGHEKGAFTGAFKSREGLAEAADEGTLFLDEIGELGLPMQIKLLRFLESGEIRRVGSNRIREVSVRVVAATNRRLSDAVRDGLFREDLFYRLRVFAIEVPPLRARLSDVPLLVDHFLGTLRVRPGPFEVDVEAMELMCGYPWPGNVRELRNAVERMMLLSRDGKVDASCLPPEIATAPAIPLAVANDLNLARIEKETIRRALAECDGRKTEAARRLGISIRTLYNRLNTWAEEERA